MSQKWKKSKPMTRHNQPIQTSAPILQPAVLPVGHAVQSDPEAGANNGGAAGQQAAKDTLEFAWKIHGYANEYIRFADGKAGAVMAWSAAMIGALFTAKIHHYFLVWPSWDWGWKPTLLGAVAVLAYLLLMGGVLHGVGAISPRLQPGPLGQQGWKQWFLSLASKDAWKESFRAWWSPPAIPPGLIFWDQIVAHGNQAAYWASLSAQQLEQLARAVTDHDYVLAQINSKKYRCVRRSIRFAFWGSVAAVIMILFAVCPPGG
jgi:hypothetical protein